MNTACASNSKHMEEKSCKSQITKSLRKCLDDGSDEAYERRKAFKFITSLACFRRVTTNKLSNNTEVEVSENLALNDDFQIPEHLWKKLHKYQKVGVHWLLDCYSRATGAILGDEMGLGKTVQLIAFLISLFVSNKYVQGFRYELWTVEFEFNLHSNFSIYGLGSVLIACPATLLFHWVQELHHWWPRFRVAVLHESGSFEGPRENLIRSINKSRGILITSYGMMLRFENALLQQHWHIAVLDEGHLIRNPDAKLTKIVKQLRTPYRIIITGSPMQNSLRELWSLFDFVYPGLLGSLSVFLRELGVPITQGGYATATALQVRTAYKCAFILRNAIAPYLLRRMKSEVQAEVNLPSKKEHILFCQLTGPQKSLYKQYANSEECKAILSGKLDIFLGLAYLRKLCNHPDLVSRAVGENSNEFGYFRRSGKMIVLHSLLKLWKQENHRILLFSQSRQMLNILEDFLKKRNYAHLRMDGTTAVGSRQSIVTTFNENADIFVLLLTTRVGGLGLDLTGADRVILYDPDWNPTTDAQAQERAWRLGQSSDVVVYRLVSSGTVEEKIYHRQIFKQFLMNRVLRNSRQRRFFKGLNTFDLFTYVDTDDNETSTVFKEASSVKKEVLSQVRKAANKRYRPTPGTDSAQSLKLSEEVVEKLKQKAKMIAQSLGTASSSVGTSNQAAENSLTLTNMDKHVIVDESVDEEDAVQSSCEDYILQSLLSACKIDSALSHDHVLQTVTNECYDEVEEEAERIAQAAIKNLKRSCGQARRKFDARLSTAAVRVDVDAMLKSNPFSQPTTSASTAVPEFPKPVSGGELLAVIERRQQILGQTVSREGVATIKPVDTHPDLFRPVNVRCRYTDLLEDIREFLKRNGSQASTEQILEEFATVVSHRDSAVFKSMLREICSFKLMKDLLNLKEEQKPPLILDVQQVVENYAFHHFDQVRHLLKNTSRLGLKTVERADVDFEINTKHLTMEHLPPEFTQWNNVSSKPCTLFKAVFTNNTDREQAYSFKTDRITESLCTVYREQGFDIGGEAELTLATPCQILEFKAGFKHEIQVKKGQEQADAELLSWSVDSAIIVPPHYQTTAQLTIQENTFKGNFTVSTRLAGSVAVMIRRRRDGELLMPVSAGVVEIFQQFLRNESNNNSSATLGFKNFVSISNGWVIINTKGRCGFQFAVNQNVELEEHPLHETKLDSSNSAHIDDKLKISRY
ncbi:DNA excision repair protein ERCC-6 [Trichinella britovi]|uniref:DNA repair and recombination protein RAD54-like n=1 Tax=Trichinella britovi TaxID=45882 RepID=A0A0V1CK99_TRIBR|nr:DNA excision repair protein ERCC-6 [Trichinella britovi]